VFRDDNPKLPQPLPRYLPLDVDRRITTVLREQPGDELAACALRLQRCCGLRIGKLLDLELDCVHETRPRQLAESPLGKLDTERMVPIDDGTPVFARLSQPPGRTSRPAERGRPLDCHLIVCFPRCTYRFA